MKKTDILKKEIILEEGVFKSNFKKVVRTNFKINFLPLIIVLLVIILGSTAGYFSSIKEDNRLILRILLAFVSFAIIPTATFLMPELDSRHIIIMILITAVCIALLFFHSFVSKETNKENLFSFSLASFAAAFIILFLFDKNIPILLYFSFFYFSSFILFHYLYPKIKKI